MVRAIDSLRSFDINSLPDLDAVVIGALELIEESQLPAVPEFERPLVVGSVNSESTGRILFDDKSAVFADESNFEKQLKIQGHTDGIVVVSASGGKHAVGVVRQLVDKGREVVLLTNNPGGPAANLLNEDRVIVFPRNREPYTYNTSTYFSMIFAKTGEDAAYTKTFIKDYVEPVLLRDLATYSAYTFIVPPRFAHVRPMLRTKFDELFGPKLVGRIFTSEEIKHAKTLVKSGDELFVSFGEKNEQFGQPRNRLNLPLPELGAYGTILAVSYYFIGKIQKANPPYFKEAILTYTQQASEVFGQSITPIVE